MSGELAIFGIASTIAFYAAALLLCRRWPWMHPLVVTTLLLMVLLVGMSAAWHRSVEDVVKWYNAGGDVLRLLLGPATVALAVPLYRRLAQIRAQALPMLGGVVLGGTLAVATSWVVVRGLGGERGVALAMLSRSVTTPISIGIARELHADESLAAVFTVLSGLLGAVIGPPILRGLGIRRDLALGLGIGTASHGIGTSSLIRHSESQGAAAGLAMALNGIFTSLLMIPLYPHLLPQAPG